MSELLEEVILFDDVFFHCQLLDLMEKKRTDDYRAFTDALETHYPHLFLSLTGPIDEIETGMCDIIGNTTGWAVSTV